MRFADRSVYEGEWQKNMMQGEGKLIYPNKDVYEG